MIFECSRTMFSTTPRLQLPRPSKPHSMAIFTNHFDPYSGQRCLSRNSLTSILTQFTCASTHVAHSMARLQKETVVLSANIPGEIEGGFHTRHSNQYLLPHAFKRYMRTLIWQKQCAIVPIIMTTQKTSTIRTHHLLHNLMIHPPHLLHP